MSRGGAVTAAAAAIALVFAAGCGPQAEGDPNLAVYLSAPLSGPSAADGRDIADGARLALADAGGQAGGTAVSLEVMDDAGPSGWDAAAAGANARRAIQDSTAIAYIGELESGATRTSLPITNEAGLLQVSAGSGAEDLTSEAIGSDQVPSLTQPSGSRTFGRVIPSDVAQGEAAAVWMGGAGITSVEVLGGKDPFGESLVAGLESSSGGPSVVGRGQGAEAIYEAQDDPFGHGRPGLIPVDPAPVFGSDAMLDPSDLTSLRIVATGCERGTGCGGNRRPIRATSAAMDPSQLPDAEFGDAFEAAYDREPGRYAAYGYEAMAVVLDSIERADDPLDRTAVLDAFFATEDRESILGTYSIDEAGDTTLRELGAYRIAGGRPVPEPQPLELP